MNKAQTRNHAFWYRLILKMSDESVDYIPLREDIDRRNQILEIVKDIVTESKEFIDQSEEIINLVRNYDCVSEEVILQYFPEL